MFIYFIKCVTLILCPHRIKKALAQGAQRIFFELWGDSLMPGHNAAPTALVLGLWPVFGAQNTSLKGTGRITLLFFPHSLLFYFI